MNLTKCVFHFFSLPVVLLFTLVQSEGSVGVSFRQRLTLTAPVWDIAFVDSGRLLVLQSQEGNPALVFLVSDPDSLSDVRN